MIIAAWSGPRNLSTAMMYAFGARSDCEIMDEPFYAAYLAATGADHPMRKEVLRAGLTDPQAVAALCSRGADKTAHMYQKHMTQHMTTGFDRDWFRSIDVHVFLIRHPARVLASYAAKRENPTQADIGFVQQAEIFAQAQAAGLRSVVIDSFDIRAAPERMLRKLCDALGIGFDPGMLRWPAGGHPSDGVWAAHWYDAVHRSTGFAGPEDALPDLPDPLHALAAEATPCYDLLKSHALVPHD